MENNIAYAERAARRFFKLAVTAAKYGGFWVSAGGGTANVAAGVIARRCGVPFEVARNILSDVGQEWAGEDWYMVLAEIQPWRWDDWHDDVPGRWDVSTIAKAACRAVLKRPD